MEYSDVEKLAIMQAIYSEAARYVSTKDPDSLRAEADRSYKRLYEDTGAKSFDVKLNGSKVGTYSIRMSKRVPAKEAESFEVCDYAKLAGWFNDDERLEHVKRYAALDLARFAEWYLKDTGEMPEGCALKQTITPEDEPHYIGGTLKVDTESVVAALGGKLGTGVEYLLYGGEDD